MTTLADGFLFHANKNPDQPAFILDAVTLSYAELAAQATRWRVYLAQQSQLRHSLEPPQFEYVAWSGSNHHTLPALYLACVQSGYCLMLLDPTWPATTTRMVLQRFSPLAVVGPDTKAGKEKAGTPGGSLPDGQLDSFFLLGFTSGSTGFPKAFIRRQSSWINTFAHATAEFPTLSRVLAPGPLSHGLSFYAMAEALQRGGTFYALKQFDAVAAQQVLAKNAIEVLVVVPTMLLAILEQATSNNVKSALKLIVSAGAKLSSALQQSAVHKWPRIALIEYYGASELSFVSVSHASESAPVNSVGRAFAGVKIIIRGVDGQALACNQQGVIYVRSDMVAEGYVLESGEMSELARIDGTVTVGDIGMLDEQGYLFLLDRLDSMIISGGLNIYPAEVQSVLDTHPAVRESRVTSVDDPYWGEKVCAFLCLEPGTSISVDSFKEYCQHRLSAHQVPRKLLTIERWPLTSSGKIAMAELRALAAADASGDSLSDNQVVRVLDE